MTMTDEVDISTDKEIHARDWECRDCGIWFSADNDASSFDFPDLCIGCGDNVGWINVKDGRTVP